MTDRINKQRESLWLPFVIYIATKTITQEQLSLPVCLGVLRY